MGCRFEIGINGSNQVYTEDYLDYAIQEIVYLEELLSTYKEESQTNLINRNAGIRPVQVDRKVFELISYSINISKITGGAFDITYGSCNNKFWNFDLKMDSFPVMKNSQQISNIVNYRNIILDRDQQTVFLKEKETKIGFGGIGKGYAADIAMQLFKKEGFHNGFINASGDIRAWGHAPGKDHWSIGIKDPVSPGENVLNLKIKNGAVATSGNYERYVNIAGELFSHTINPFTGYPVQALKSVTVIAPTGIFADALATSISVIGVEAGLNMVMGLTDVHCFIIDNHNQYHLSANFRESVAA